jgi:hypothetical protein
MFICIDVLAGRTTGRTTLPIALNPEVWNATVVINRHMLHNIIMTLYPSMVSPLIISCKSGFALSRQFIIDL